MTSAAAVIDTLRVNTCTINFITHVYTPPSLEESNQILTSIIGAKNSRSYNISKKLIVLN